jgi:hypothetical protein
LVIAGASVAKSDRRLRAGCGGWSCQIIAILGFLATRSDAGLFVDRFGLHRAALLDGLMSDWPTCW